jgi:hypothetical protein
MNTAPYFAPRCECKIENGKIVHCSMCGAARELLGVIVMVHRFFESR